MSNTNIIKMTLEDIMSDRFSRYSKYIIQDRALPDIRDGLKPVQRRVLYAMYSDNNTFDKPYRKSAKTVGNVIGNFHPHGDTSVYDAMVRMSQDFKQRMPLIDMHGNNGSIDGDSAAAMRYTEARLSSISGLLLEDIKKNTVDHIYNFDDTMLEPVVLPAKYPNLVVNGSSGISAGYATNIPPHNLNEVLKALIFLIKNPNCRVDTLVNYIEGPDFPTGGVASGREEIVNALTTGKGRVVVKSKYEITGKKNKRSIVISEIPFEVNKASLVYKISEIKELKKIDGISEVRDESDKSGIRIVIDLKAEAKEELIVNYLLKNTDMQVYYNYNMVAIVNRTPKLVNIKDILEAYLAHQREVYLKAFQFDLDKILNRLHIIDGLVIALDDIDLLIKTIRASSNKKEAVVSVANIFSLTSTQAEAIVNLQLYRLTNTDVFELQSERDKLKLESERLQSIINSSELLDECIINKLKEVGKEFSTDRKTKIESTHEVIKIDEKELINNDKVIISVTKDGYIKKVSLKSYTGSNFSDFGRKENDFLLLSSYSYELDSLLLFTNKGNYIIIPNFELAFSKWKELGTHVNQYVLTKSDEEIVNAFIFNSFDQEIKFTVFTSDGYGKIFNLKDLKVSRFNKSYTYMKLSENANVTNVDKLNGEEIVAVSKLGLALRFGSNELSEQGAKSKGIKVMSLKDDEVVYASSIMEKYLLLITNENHIKRFAINEVSKLSRGRKGSSIIHKMKTKQLYYEHVMQIGVDNFVVRFANNTDVVKASSINIVSSSGNGGVFNRNKVEGIGAEIADVVKACDKINKVEKIKNDDIIKVDEITVEAITIDDLLD